MSVFAQVTPALWQAETGGSITGTWAQQETLSQRSKAEERVIEQGTEYPPLASLCVLMRVCGGGKGGKKREKEGEKGRKGKREGEKDRGRERER